jgi:hypothetical protein
MATHDYIIGNQGFPAFRSDLNDVLAAIVSNNSSATEPATKYAYMMWYDSTTNIWKMRNAANDAWISLATFDQATNTVNFLDSSVSILGLATSATGTVLTLTDTHLDSTVSIRLPDATSIADDSGNEYIKFAKTASAVNEVSVTNNSTGNNPIISASGGDTDIGIEITPKGTGEVIIGASNLNYGGTAITATGEELNYSDLATLGTTAASKVFTADANNLTTVSGAVANVEDELTDGATITWDVIDSPVAKVTLGGNRTLSAPSGTTPIAGQFVSLLIIQDGTGSRTVTWNAVYEFAEDTAPDLTATASKGDLFTFRYNGSKWLEIGRNLDLTLS